MRALINGSTDPYYNLALEEYLTRTSDCDVFMLWRNSPSVIIGKNQNAWSEIDVSYVREHSIPVVRRMTGGGAVFHDLGNVNYSFITRADGTTRLNFEKFTRPVILALKSLGIDASLDGRNDVVCGGAKISGNAECVINNDAGVPKMLHHGTLLFSANVSSLAAALSPDDEKMKSKGIKSVKNRVINIADIEGYSGPETVEEFLSYLMKYISPSGADGLTAAERSAAGELMREKYSKWEWNFGTSPAFENTRKARFSYGVVEASFSCRKGVISEIRINGDFFGTGDVEKLERLLVGKRLDYETLLKTLEENEATLGESIAGASGVDIASLIAG